MGYSTDGFAQRVARSEAAIYRSCARPESEILRLDGVARNIGGREVRFMELEVDSVDAKEENIPQAATALPDIMLYTNQTSPFHL